MAWKRCARDGGPARRRAPRTRRRRRGATAPAAACGPCRRCWSTGRARPPRSDASSSAAIRVAFGFRRRALPRVVAHHERAQAEVPDVPADVHGRRPPVDLAPVLGPRLPAPRHLLLEGDEREVLEEAEEVDDRVALRARERRDRHAAVAEHDRRRAVGGQRIEVGVPPHRAVDVGVGLDDARASRTRRRRRSRARRRARASGPTSTMRPPRTRTSALRAAAPVPSTTVPPRTKQLGHAVPASHVGTGRPGADRPISRPVSTGGRSRERGTRWRSCRRPG